MANKLGRVKEVCRFSEREEINRLRLASGMSEIREISRSCLKCDKPFLSVGNSNRMCENCRKLVQNKSDDVHRAVLP